MLHLSLFHNFHLSQVKKKSKVATDLRVCFNSLIRRQHIKDGTEGTNTKTLAMRNDLNQEVKRRSMSNDLNQEVKMRSMHSYLNQEVKRRSKFLRY